MNRANVAIIGIGGKYPKAESPRELWNKILADDDLSSIHSQNDPNKVNRCYPLDGIEMFDYEFFGYTPAEASITDPQYRVLAECLHRALEDSGYENLSDCYKVGIFTSSSMSSYLLNIIMQSDLYKRDEIDYPILIGNDKDFLATKIAYKFNFLGPALSIQCGCSSSLVATHYACQSLLNNESEISIVGAVSILIPQEKGYEYKEGGIFSKDGLCRPFDHKSSGTNKGNGCSVLILKRLSDAIRDNDSIHGIINGISVNNDGSFKVGYTAPSIQGEFRAIYDALCSAGISAHEVGYIETHGTGTYLGDPIEIKALNKAYGGGSQKIPLGSIKANIGHLDCAAGITSIIKALFVLQDQKIPKLRNFEKENSLIEGLQHAFEFPIASRSHPLSYVAVSSFGLGGTNAHCIISKHERGDHPDSSPLSLYLIPFYLNKQDDWLKYRNSLICTLEKVVSFHDFAISMAIGKKARAHCIPQISATREDAITKLSQLTDPFIASYPQCIPRFSQVDFEYLMDVFPSLKEVSRSVQASEIQGVELAEMYEQSFHIWLRKLNVDMNQKEKGLYESSNPLSDLLLFLCGALQKEHIDFTLLYRGITWKRIPLTNYPFSKKRCWIDVPKHRKNTKQAALISSSREILHKVIQIWRNKIGITEIDEDTEFFSVGGDSLIAIEILNEINKLFDTSLSLNDFNSHLCPNSLARLLSEKKQAQSINSVVTRLRKSTEDNATIFFMHPAGGTTLCYNRLNHFLMGDYNLFAIDLPPNYNEFSSMHTLASYYCREIRKHQEKGPYILGGYSFGGNIAYEMAAQLEEAGERVSFIIMFDSHPPSAYTESHDSSIDYKLVMPDILMRYFNNDRINPETKRDFAKMEISDIVDILLSQYSLKSPLTASELLIFFEQWVFCHKLLKAHIRIDPVESDILFFVAKEDEDIELLQSLAIKKVSKEHWRNYSSGRVDMVFVEGNHYSLFGQKNCIRQLAQAFDANIKQRGI